MIVWSIQILPNAGSTEMAFRKFLME